MPREAKKYPFNNEPRILCRYGCGRMIYFVKTANQSDMPVDFETKEAHFGHCPPYLQAHRKKKEPNA